MKSLYFPKPLALGLVFAGSAVGTLPSHAADDGSCKVAYQQCLDAKRPAKVCYQEWLDCTGAGKTISLSDAIKASEFAPRNEAELDAFLSSLE